MLLVVVCSIVLQVFAVALVVSSIRSMSRLVLYLSIPFIFLVILYTLFSSIFISNLQQSYNFTILIINTATLLAVIHIVYVSKKYYKNLTYFEFQQDIDRSVLLGLTHNVTMKTIIKRLNSLLRTDAAAIIVTSENDRGFKLLASSNLDKDVQSYFNARYDGLISSVLKKRSQIVIPRISESENETFLGSVRDAGFSSFLGSPIIMKGGRPVGVLALYSKKPRKYTHVERSLINTIGSQISITLDRAQLIERIQEINFESVRALVEAIEIRDPYTRGHSTQVADMAVTLAEYLGFSKRQLRLIEFAGLLHDIGKIAVPEMILQKTSSLTDDEWLVIKKHTQLSARIIDPISHLKPIQNWILYHHERWDGSGYPTGRKGSEIPLESRILAVCDTYSAMTGDRPYRKALSNQQSRREIQRVSGAQLDPDIAKAFLNVYVA